jgi:hypothetical protein
VNSEGGIPQAAGTSYLKTRKLTVGLEGLAAIAQHQVAGPGSNPDLPTAKKFQPQASS